jgi:hypothetical protein
MEKAGGFAFQTCANAAWVSKRIETSRRREVLPWSFHNEVAGLKDAAAQDNALDWAEARWPDVTPSLALGSTRGARHAALGR